MADDKVLQIRKTLAQLAHFVPIIQVVIVEIENFERLFAELGRKANA
jgi:hypothetical protein